MESMRATTAVALLGHVRANEALESTFAGSDGATVEGSAGPLGFCPLSGEAVPNTATAPGANRKGSR